MSVTAAQVVVKVGVDNSGLKSGLQEAEDTTKEKSSSIKGMLGNMFSAAGGFLIAQGVALGLSTLSDAISSVFDEASKMDTAMSLLNGTLASTRDASGMTVDGIMSVVDGLSNLSGASKSTILSGEDMLLTFTNIGSSVFPLASTAMLNMAIAMNNGSTTGLDLKDTAIQLGKALNDPITGLSALSRVGVTFTDQQKAQIKAMQDAGDMAGAQKIILQELQKEFGSASESAGNTFDGALNKVKNTLINFGVEGLQKVEAWLQPFVQELAVHLPDILSNLGDFFGQAGKHIGDFFGILSNLGGSASSGMDFGGIVTQFKSLGTTIQTQVLPVVQQFADWFQKVMIPAIQQAMPTVQNFAKFIVNDLVPAFIQIETYGVKVGAVIAKTLLPIFETIEPIIVRVGTYLLDMSQKALAFLIPKVEQAVKAISDFATEMSTRLGPFINQMVAFIKGAATVIGDVWGFLWPWMSGILKTAWDLITGLISIAWQVITGIFKIGADLLSGNWSQLWADVLGLFSGVQGAMHGMMAGLWDDIKGLWTTGTTMIHDVWSTVWNGLAGIAGSAWDGVKGTIRNGINGAIDLINDLIRQADKVPGVSIPQIGHVNFATGGDMLRSGMALVGENGPELLALPGGSHVYNNTQTQQMLSGPSRSGDTYNFNGATTETMMRQFNAAKQREQSLVFGGRR